MAELPTTHDDVMTRHMFQVFNEIRTKLVEEGGISDLPLEFPIVEMEWSEETDNFLGMCHFTTRFETAADIKKRPMTTQHVEKVSMRVLCRPEDGKEDHHFNLLRLIPTLLHEFAHVTTELSRVLPDQAASSRNRKLKKLEHFSHDDEFYGHFRRILKAAEGLGIYSLPNTPNRYNCPALRRFDQVDLEVCPLSLCGSSKLYSGHINVDSADKLEIIPTPANLSLNLTLTNAKGVRKFLQLKEADLDTLKTLAAKKYGQKGQLKLFTNKGEEITPETFHLVQTGDTIQVS
jgi:hypothetical protein